MAIIHRFSSMIAIMQRPYQSWGISSLSVNGFSEPSTNTSMVLLSNKSMVASTVTSADSIGRRQSCHRLVQVPSLAPSRTRVPSWITTPAAESVASFHCSELSTDQEAFDFNPAKTD